MRLRHLALALLAVAVVTASLHAQSAAPAESLIIDAQHAYTWASGETNIVQVEGPVTIQIDRMRLSAKQAVIWLTPADDGRDIQQADIVLMGDAKIEQGDIVRSGDTLKVDARIRGTIRITAEERLVRNMSDSDVYKEAAASRTGAPTTSPIVAQPLTEGDVSAQPATTRPTTRAALMRAPVRYSGNLESLPTTDGKVGIAMTGGVVLYQQRPNGDLMELQANRAVLFTDLNNLREVADLTNRPNVENSINGAYLEGDVRIVLTPARTTSGEQRLEANRVYYDFNTDRAVLTDAVIHTIEPEKQIPVIVRARAVRQLSQGEWSADHAEVSTSSFAVPSYSMRTERAYIRQVDTGDPRYGTLTMFSGTHATMNAFGVPFFYFPKVGGLMTEKGFPLRGVEFGGSRNFGLAVRTEWGLFESLGRLPPPDLDASYQLDYYQERGFGFGLNADYGGGFVTQTTKRPWNFQGDVRSYFVLDHGIDDLGRERANVDPDETIRGRVRWEHQHFFPDDWQVQLRTGWTSDPTFLEEWFQGEFDTALPLESSIYVKRQRDTEAFTFLATAQPNNFVTSADFLQEQFEVERLPEIGYHRIGDSFGDDRFTFFSDNTVSALSFQRTNATLRQQGFRPNSAVTKFSDRVVPGLPSLGLVGADGPPDVPEDTDYRGDFRQEVDYPFAAGEFKIVPYIVGRYTSYSDSPDGSSVDRFFAGAGARVSTTFWKIDNSAHSELFDIHRVRHVIEPELHVFTGAQTTDANQFFIYDEQIDRINDVSGASIGVHQRWQTKRGSKGNERSVDFLTLNVAATFYNNQPTDDELAPIGFRGLFYPSLPEASIPRDSINADAMWRISDSTVVLGDAVYNTQEGDLATASVGLAVRRDTRLSYFVGTRYIGELDSNITSIIAEYELTRKYSVQLRQSYDFGQRRGVYSAGTLIRHFDRFFALFTVYNDTTENDSGISFAILPEGLSARSNVNSQALSNIFGP